MDSELENDSKLPVRKPMNHRGPLSVDVSDAVYFITIVAAERDTAELTDKAAVILDAARFYQALGKWMLYLFLVMPDHIHMLVHVPIEVSAFADWRTGNIAAVVTQVLWQV